jgi:sec-independent protein translocase protein TatB
MFDFDAGKLIVIGIVALIVIGPKELPRVLRQLGQAYTKMRRMAADFQGQFMDAMREAELDDIKKDLQSVGDATKLDVAFNPLADIKEQMTSAIEGPVTKPPGEASEMLPAYAAGSLNSIDLPTLPLAEQQPVGGESPSAVEVPGDSVPADPPGTRTDAERLARLDSAADPVPAPSEEEVRHEPAPLKTAHG